MNMTLKTSTCTTDILKGYQEQNKWPNEEATNEEMNAKGQKKEKDQLN